MCTLYLIEKTTIITKEDRVGRSVLSVMSIGKVQ